MGIKAMCQAAIFSVDDSQYYYSRLTGKQKKIYKTLLLGIKAFTKKIKMPITPINEVSLIFDYILLDNPLIFYVSAFSQSNDVYKEKSVITFDYKYNRQAVRQMHETISSYLQKFDAVKEKSDIDKELYVHDLCLNNFQYDYAFDDYSYSVLGPVINKTAVCEGIANFVKLALDYLGVKCLIVHGKADDPADDFANRDHAWNIVEINGRTYHLDITFNMTLTEKVIRYDYFNLSDTDIKKEHTIISEAPACITSGKDYYTTNSFSARNSAELERYIINNLKQGKKNIIIKLALANYSEKIVDKITEITQKQCGNIVKRSGTFDIRCNPGQMVFEINFK